jgi:cytochrome c556
MIRSRVALLTLVASGLVLTAQENHEFEAWMKSVGSSTGAIRKMEKKTGPEVVAGAEKISGVYENMIAFWRQRNADDAIKLSQDGKAATAELASAAGAGDEAKAAAAFAKVGGTCKPCHDAHREKNAEGKYIIK